MPTKIHTFNILSNCWLILFYANLISHTICFHKGFVVFWCLHTFIFTVWYLYFYTLYKCYIYAWGQVANPNAELQTNTGVTETTKTTSLIVMKEEIMVFSWKDVRHLPIMLKFLLKRIRSKASFLPLFVFKHARWG